MLRGNQARVVRTPVLLVEISCPPAAARVGEGEQGGAAMTMPGRGLASDNGSSWK
jgi:hypothetical protein